MSFEALWSELRMSVRGIQQHSSNSILLILAKETLRSSLSLVTTFSSEFFFERLRNGGDSVKELTQKTFNGGFRQEEVDIQKH